jgi:hypothetical protein
MNFISELLCLQSEFEKLVQKKALANFSFEVRDNGPWPIEVNPHAPDAFVRFSLQAGRLLAHVPELVTRISSQALAEPDPAKRWFRLLLDFSPGMIFWEGEQYPAFRVNPRSVVSRRKGWFHFAAERSLALIERLALMWETNQASACRRQGQGRPPLKRGARAANIERLTEAMIAHLRAAKDHANSTQDTTGIPDLLPRPQQKELGALTGLLPSTVNRCLKDPRARELALYWKTARDLDLIQKWPGPIRRRQAG